MQFPRLDLGRAGGWGGEVDFDYLYPDVCVEVLKRDLFEGHVQLKKT